MTETFIFVSPSNANQMEKRYPLNKGYHQVPLEHYQQKLIRWRYSHPLNGPEKYAITEAEFHKRLENLQRDFITK